MGGAGYGHALHKFATAPPNSNPRNSPASHVPIVKVVNVVVLYHCACIGPIDLENPN